MTSRRHTTGRPLSRRPASTDPSSCFWISGFPAWNEAVWAWNGQDVADRFEAHWSGNVGGRWTIVSLPEAVAEHLVERVKHISAPPTVDPEETREAADAEADQVRLEFVAAAPRLGAGTGVGYVTAGVEPWPHQLSIARRVVDSFPRSYLLSDEVGLGKTIEAGLILRELLVSGRASTALLLVPASVIRQWQEELDEKFSLLVPRQEGGRFFTRRAGIDQELPGPGGNPWEAFPVLLASSHLGTSSSSTRRTMPGDRAPNPLTHQTRCWPYYRR